MRTDRGEHIRAGLENARRNGTRSGRPIGRPRSAVDPAEVARLKAQGWSWPKIARRLGVGQATAIRAFQAATKAPEGFGEALTGQRRSVRQGEEAAL